MEAANADGLDRGADQLFLAARAGCELGAGTVFSRAACDAGVDLLAWIPDCGTTAGLFSDALVSRVGDTPMEAEIGVASTRRA
jgi:hypothetical protein